VIIARNANIVIFTVCGVIGGSWWSRLPEVKALLNISTGQLSLLLLCIAIGSMASLPIAGKIANKFGAKNSLRLGAALCFAGLLIASVCIQEQIGFFWPQTGLLVFGFGVGLWDVAQNIEGASIEQRLGQTVMPWFHAAFSGGTILGSLLGALATQFKFTIIIHLCLTILVSAICLAWASSHYSSISTMETNSVNLEGSLKSRSAWTEPRTLLIGVVVLAAGFTEGTANDWVAVAFVDGHQTSMSTGVLGLTTFLVFMTAGRIFGTKFLDRFGRVLTLRALLFSAIIGCTLMVFGTPEIAFLGSALWGLGASLGFPVGMSAAADNPSRAAERISVVATIGYLSFLAGPVLIGYLGETVGILRALLAVVATCVLALLSVQAVRPLPSE
jgi:MFS family permease